MVDKSEFLNRKGEIRSEKPISMMHSVSAPGRGMAAVAVDCPMNDQASKCLGRLRESHRLSVSVTFCMCALDTANKVYS